MNRRNLLAAASLGAATAALSACATVKADLSAAVAAMTSPTAIKFWGFAKGAIEIALLADPSLAVIVNAAIAIGDALAADAASSSATAAQSAAQLVTHAATVVTQTAQVVTIVPNAVTNG